MTSADELERIDTLKTDLFCAMVRLGAWRTSNDEEIMAALVNSRAVERMLDGVLPTCHR